MAQLCQGRSLKVCPVPYWCDKVWKRTTRRRRCRAAQWRDRAKAIHRRSAPFHIGTTKAGNVPPEEGGVVPPNGTTVPKRSISGEAGNIIAVTTKAEIVTRQEDDSVTANVTIVTTFTEGMADHHGYD